MHGADELCAVFNPTVNSYKRINAPRTLSGATWSPNAVSYSGNNRTHMIRDPRCRPASSCACSTAPRTPISPRRRSWCWAATACATRRDPGPRLDCNMYTEGHLHPELQAPAAQPARRDPRVRGQRRRARGLRRRAGRQLRQAEARRVGSLLQRRDRLGARDHARLLSPMRCPLSVDARPTERRTTATPALPMAKPLNWAARRAPVPVPPQEHPHGCPEPAFAR